MQCCKTGLVALLLGLLVAVPALASDRIYGPEPLKRKVEDGKGPRIVFEEETYEWGSVLQGDDIEHTFIFKNQGNDTLKILDVKPG